jgi:hypothetical protein
MPEARIQIAWAADPAALGDAIVERRLLGVYASWLGMPEYPRLPALASIDRADLMRIWTNAVLVEVTREGRFRYRTAGPEVAKRLGRDIAGQFMDEIISGSSRATLTTLYELTVKVRAAVYSRTRMAVSGGDAEMIVHRLMLPISNDGRRVDMVVAAQTFEAAAGIAAETADFTIGTMNRAEWNTEAWIDSLQAAASGAAAP